MQYGKQTMQARANKSVLAMVILCVSVICFWTGAGHGQVPDFARLDDQLRAIIKDKSTPDTLLLEAISRLGKTSETPDFWTHIANDPNYSMQHRRRAVFALFRRHCQRIGELHALGECLKPAKWLEESSVEKLPFVFGWVPVDVNPNESIFCVSVLYGWRIYIRMAGDVEEDTVRPVLCGKEVKNLKKSLIVMQCGYGDDYEHWLANPPDLLVKAGFASSAMLFDDWAKGVDEGVGMKLFKAWASSDKQSNLSFWKVDRDSDAFTLIGKSSGRGKGVVLGRGLQGVEVAWKRTSVGDIAIVDHKISTGLNELFVIKPSKTDDWTLLYRTPNPLAPNGLAMDHCYWSVMSLDAESGSLRLKASWTFSNMSNAVRKSAATEGVYEIPLFYGLRSAGKVVQPVKPKR